VAIHFCDQCGRVLPTPPDADAFEILGIERRLDLDAQELEQRYYALSRRCHPDFYQTRPEWERQTSLEKSAAVNAAYATLADPVQRVEYLLRQEGLGVEQAGNRVPPAIAATLFEVQEALAPASTTPGAMHGPLSEPARAQLEACVANLRAQEAASLQRLQQAAVAWSRSPSRVLLEQLQQEAVTLRYLRGHAAQAVAALAAGGRQSSGA
jgi:molecular chaperone HscB